MRQTATIPARALISIDTHTASVTCKLTVALDTKLQNDCTGYVSSSQSGPCILKQSCPDLTYLNDLYCYCASCQELLHDNPRLLRYEYSWNSWVRVAQGF